MSMTQSVDGGGLHRRHSALSHASSATDASQYEALLPQGSTPLQRAMSEIGPPGAHHTYGQVWGSGAGQSGGDRATARSPSFPIPASVPEGMPTSLASVLGDLERELDLLDAQGIGGGSPQPPTSPQRSPVPFLSGGDVHGAPGLDAGFTSVAREGQQRQRQPMDTMRLSANLQRARSMLGPSRASGRPRSRLLAGYRVSRRAPARLRRCIRLDHAFVRVCLCS